MPRESDPTVAAAIEGMNPEQFSVYLENRRSCLSSLSINVIDYPAKRKLLQYAVDSERNAAENVRAMANVTVQADAAGLNLTADKRNSCLISLRKGLFIARETLIFAKLISTDSLATAFEVIGGGSTDSELTAEEKKRMEEVRRKHLQPPASATASASVTQDNANATAMLQSFLQSAAGSGWGNKRDSSSLLTMMAAGAPKNKTPRTKGNSPCFACFKYGHWAGDPECEAKKDHEKGPGGDNGNKKDG